MTLGMLFTTASLALALPGGSIASAAPFVEAVGHDRENCSFENKISPMKGGGHRPDSSSAVIRKGGISWKPAKPSTRGCIMANRCLP